MEQITDYIEKFKADLPELFDNVLSSYQDKINGEFANEYNIPEHEYVQSHPLVQLNDKLFDFVEKLDFMESCRFKFQNNVWIINDRHYPVFKFIQDTAEVKYDNHNRLIYTFNDKCCYKNIKLIPKNEYVIGFIINYKYIESNGNRGDVARTKMLIYITNYGRFIHVERQMYGDLKTNLCHLFNYDDKNIFIKDDKIYIYNYEYYNRTNLGGILIAPGYPKLLTDIDANEPPLTYKFPKLFLDVINAFRNESTDEMQKCCEKYNLLLQKANNGNDKKIKHLEDENTRLKKEIELLKIQLEEQRKHFMG